MGSLKSAMVSLWKDKHNREEKNFLGTGVFIAPRCILTVKHIAETQDPLFAISYTSVLASQIRRVECHEELDISLIWLADHPADAKIIQVDDSAVCPGDYVEIGGYFEGQYESPSDAIVKKFVQDDRNYLVDVKQPVGYSGSPVGVGGKVKGVVCRHYDDKNIHRGCFIAVSQFIDWLNPHIDKASAPTTQASEQPIDANALAHIHKQARSEIRRVLSGKLFGVFQGLECDEKGVPSAIRDALAHDADTAGKESVGAILQIVKDMRATMEDEQVQLTPKEKATVRKQIAEGLGWAARLCIDKGGVHYVSARNFVDLNRTYAS